MREKSINTHICEHGGAALVRRRCELHYPLGTHGTDDVADLFTIRKMKNHRRTFPFEGEFALRADFLR